MSFTFSIQFIPLIFSMFFSFGLLVYLLRYFDSQVVKTLVIMLAGGFVWSMGHLLEYGSNELDAKLFWVNIGYLGLFVVPVGWLVMALLYSGRQHFVTVKIVLIISIIPVLTLLLDATNSWHGLMRYDVSLDHNGTFSVIKRTPGIWFWVNLIYINALMLAGTALMVKRFFTPPKIQRKQILLIIFSIIIPWSGTFISVFNVFPLSRIDHSPSMLPVSIFLIVMALYPFDVFAIVPIARDFILENFSDGILVVDKANRVVDYNPAFRKMFELKQIHFSTPLSEVVSWLNLPEIIVNYSGNFTREMVYKNESGIRAYELRVSEISSKQREKIGRIFYFQDITEKKKLMENLNRNQKLESLGVLAGGIAHEFNNILSAVFGNAELAKEYSTDIRVNKFLDNALVSADRARGLTEQLVTFSKGGAPICKPEELFPFYKERVSLLLKKTGIKVNYDISENITRCLIDKGQIGTVFDGMITNAKEAVSLGGEIYILAKNIEIPANSEHPKLKEGKYAEIQIKDTGSGIKDDVLPHIFDPFFSTKKQGRGLGLSACLSIVEQHGGTITVQTEIGKGTVFVIYLKAV